MGRVDLTGLALGAVRALHLVRAVRTLALGLVAGLVALGAGVALAVGVGASPESSDPGSLVRMVLLFVALGAGLIAGVCVVSGALDLMTVLLRRDRLMPPSEAPPRPWGPDAR